MRGTQRSAVTVVPALFYPTLRKEGRVKFLDMVYTLFRTFFPDRFSGGTAEGRQAVIAQEPVRRMGTPEAIAEAVVRLCSDAASFVVGSAMIVDGGQTV